MSGYSGGRNLIRRDDLWGGGETVTAIAFESNTFSGAGGPHNAVFDTLYQASDPFGVLSDIPASMALSLETGGTEITAVENGTWSFMVEVDDNAHAGTILFGHPMFNANPRFVLPRDTAFYAAGFITFTQIISLKAGENVIVTYTNTTANACTDYIAIVVTRLGEYSPA